MRQMRVFLIVLLVSAMTGGSALAQVADVPENHWAYRAVQTLVERGYIDLASDGTFQGDMPADRYSLAAVVARLLEDIEAGRVRIREGTDAELVRRLEQEFRAELVRWHSERDALQEAFGQTQRAVAVIDAQLNDVLAELETLANDLTDLAQREARATAELRSAVEAVGGALTAGLAERDQRLAGHDEHLARHDAELARHAAELEAHATQLQSHGALLESLSTQLQSHSAELESHGAQLEQHEGQLIQQAEQLESQARAVADLHERLAQNTEQLAGRLQELQALQERLEEALRAQGVELGEEFSQRLGEQRGALERLQQDVQSLQEELARLDRRIEDQVTTAINLLEERTAALDWLMRNLESSLNALINNEVANLAAELEALRGHTDVLDRSLAGLRQLVEAMSAQQQAADQQLAARLTEQQGEMEELRSRLDQVAQEAARADAVLGEAMVTNIAALTDRLDQLEAALAEQREMLGRQTEALMGADRLILQEIDGLRQELAAIRRDVQTLRQRADTLEGHVLANQAAINVLRQDLEAAVAQTRAEQEALRQDLGDVRSAVEEVQSLIGDREEYLSRLVDELQRRMDTQLSASVLREQQLQRQLRELEQELSSLRSASEEEMSSLRGTGTLAVGAAVLAILLGVTK